MTVPRTEVYLHNVARNESEAADLLHAITARQLADWEKEWMPELVKGLGRLTRMGVELRHED